MHLAKCSVASLEQALTAARLGGAYLPLSSDGAQFFALRPLQEYHAQGARARLALVVEEEVPVDAAPSLLQFLLFRVGLEQVASPAAMPACLVGEVLQMLVVEFDGLRNSRHCAVQILQRCFTALRLLATGER